MAISLLFFGSFLEYSAHVFEQLLRRFPVTAVVTTPPKPKGRHLIPTPTDVATLARKHRLPLFELSDLNTIPTLSGTPDFLVVAGYGKLIPASWLAVPRTMSVNMHPSLLPHLRGAFPAEWAILRGDASTGVTLVKMSAEFDKGDILARQEIAISPSDTRETLYRTLYDLGTKLLIATIPKIAEGNVRPQSQAKGDYFYARRLNRVDGFIPWNLLSSAMVGEDIPAGKRPALFQSVSGHWSLVIERAVRAFQGWPGIWTEIETRDPSIRLRAGMEQGTGKKRLKILGAHIEDNKLVLDTVQLEGKSPIPYKQLSVLFE